MRMRFIATHNLPDRVRHLPPPRHPCSARPRYRLHNQRQARRRRRLSCRRFRWNSKPRPLWLPQRRQHLPPAPAKHTLTAPPAPAVNVSDAGLVTVQLAAYRTRANAEVGWQRLRAAHPDQLGDRALIMREADLGDRGIYYRVRTGPFADVAAAKAFCSLLRARDQDCLVIRLQ